LGFWGLGRALVSGKSNGEDGFGATALV